MRCLNKASVIGNRENLRHCVFVRGIRAERLAGKWSQRLCLSIQSDQSISKIDRLPLSLPHPTRSAQ